MVTRCWLTCGLLALAGCGELPEVQYHREGFDLAVEFDQPVCEGTLRAMEERVQSVGQEVGRRPSAPMTIYWLDGDLERICPRPASGCFIPGTQIVASTKESLHHEIVHAVMNTRGSNPFAEEGLAEVLSGGAAYRKRDERGSPLASFAQTRKDAREGNIDYEHAAHFMHFVRSEADEGVVAALTEAIDHDDGPRRFADLLQRHLGKGVDAIEIDYARAPAFYPSRRARETEPLSAFDLVAGVNLALDCRHEATFGPFSEHEAGMYHLLPVGGEAVLSGYLNLEADPGVRAVLFRAVDPDGAWVQDWWNPEPRRDPERVELEGGDWAWVSIDPAEHWLLMVRSSDADAAKSARLQLIDG